jgi:PAS domain S-box-containing protein
MQSISRDETRFKNILDQLPQMVWICDPNGLNTFTSRYGLEYLGVSLEQSKNIGWADFIHPDDLSQLFAKWQSSLETREPLECESRIRRASDGSYRWVLMRGFPVASPTGEILEWVGTSTDIHEQKLATEHAIRIQTATTALSVAVTAKEVAEIILAEVTNALGAKSATIAHCIANGKLAITAARGYKAQTIERFREVPLASPIPLAEAALTGEPVYVESADIALRLYPLAAAAITEYHEEAYAALPLIIDRKVTGSIGIGFATARVFSESEKRFMVTLAGVCAQAYERACLFDKEKLARSIAELASEGKSRFLGSVSHEIRTPLTAIMGFAELLQNPRENSKKYIDGIIRHSLSLIHILDDFLDLTAAEAGRLRIRNENLDIESLLEDVLATIHQLEGKDNVSLVYDQLHALPKTISSDPTRLKQVLLNVIGNAMKFTNEGKVTLAVSIREIGEDEKPNLEFTISDTGVGISAEDAAHLFEPFAQAKSALINRDRGRGLGLTIGRRIARALGGELSLLESKPGRGSVFCLSVPLNARLEKLNTADLLTSESVILESTDSKLIGKSILIAEDDGDIRHLLQSLLESEGAKVACAENGEVALAMAKENNFDLVIMDLQMPVCDGCEAAEKLRSDGINIPFIALSAHVTEHYRAKALKAGFTAYVAKPVRARDFLKLIASYL